MAPRYIAKMDPVIDDIYFKEEKEFTLDYLFDSNLTSDSLVEHKNCLERLLLIVIRKVSDLILSHQPTYVNELQRIADLQRSITESTKLCTQGRTYLRLIMEGSTIIEQYKKRESLNRLLESLLAINDLRKSIVGIKDTINEFPKAIELCRNNKDLFDTCEQFKCVTDMKRKLGLLILNHDFSSYRFDEFIKILSIIDLAMQIGNELCGCSSPEDLRDCVSTQALNFFNAYHKSSMDELKMFLENELWDRVPVKSDFKLVQLKEFSFLRDSDSDEDPSDEYISSEDEEEEQSSVSSQRYTLTTRAGPVLTNSSLNVLRLFGRYIQMMRFLEPIAYEILKRIYNLLDYYTTVVYKKFGPEDKKPEDENTTSPKLRNVIKSIRESLMAGHSSITSDTQTTSDLNIPSINNIITDDQTLGQPVDPKKAVAIESLIFLVRQLWNLQDYLESLIPAEMRAKLREQFSQNHSIVPDFLKARAEMDNEVIINR